MRTQMNVSPWFGFGKSEEKKTSDTDFSLISNKWAYWRNQARNRAALCPTLQTVNLWTTVQTSYRIVHAQQNHWLMILINNLKSVSSELFVFCAAAWELHTGQHEAGHGPNSTDGCTQPHRYDDWNRNKPAESNCRANKETDQCGGTGKAGLPTTLNIQKETKLKSAQILCNRTLKKSKTVYNCLHKSIICFLTE